MKTRCAVMEEAMAPCDALVCASIRMRRGAVRCRVVRWDGNGTGCGGFEEAGNKAGQGRQVMGDG